MKTIFTSVAFTDPQGNPLANGFLILQLSQNVEVTAGGGQVVPKMVPVPLDATGKIPANTEVLGNDELTPSGTTYTATVTEAGGTGYPLGKWSIAGASPIDVSQMVPLSIGASFPSPVLISPGSDQHITGTQNLTTPKLDGIVWVDGTQYTTIAAAYAALPSSGGVVAVPNGYAETLSANLVLGKSNAGLLFMGQATIAMGSNQIQISAGTNGAFICGWSPTGALAYSGSFTGPGGVTFVYTGSGAAVLVGGSSARTSAVRLENFGIDINGAGSSAIGINGLAWQAGGWIRGVGIRGASSGGAGGSTSQVAIQIDPGGGNNSFDFSIENNQISGVQTGILLNANAQEIYMSGNQMFFGAAASTGVSLQGCTGNTFIGGNISTFTTGAAIGGAAQMNLVQTIMGGATTTATFGASTVRNAVIQLSTDAPVFTDSGTLNRFIYGPSPIGLVNQQGASSAVTGNSSDQVLYTFPLPANTVLAGKGIRIFFSWFHNSGTTSTAYKVKVGSTTVFTQSSTGVDNSVIEYFVVYLYNAAGVQNSQTLAGQAWFRTANVSNVPLNNAGIWGQSTQSIDFTQAQTITATFNVANTDQVTPKFFSIELIQ